LRRRLYRAETKRNLMELRNAPTGKKFRKSQVEKFRKISKWKKEFNKIE